MKPFHTIAVPHRDILDKKLTMDIFAADLWETYCGNAPSEYKDPELFFKKTYLTEGLRNLFTVIETRLKGEGGDPVIQIQTPFGGGKTHALIALYHKAKEMNAEIIVISGTAKSANETLWGLIEEQLHGKIETLKGNISPGRDALKRIFEINKPILILIDELLEYTTKAAGIKVIESNLAAQTIAFMQELTETAGILDKLCVVITLPSSILEHYDTNAEKMFNQLKKVVGRVEKVYSPIRENEIAQVIRRRLFSHIDLKNIQSNVSEFLDYAERECILPVGTEISEYKKKFVDSYPFLPDVIETLYHRWGSLTTFQRTRGVLRLLSLVIYSLKDSTKPYISLADFDLSYDDIRRELIKYTGNEFDSVVSFDITNMDSGSKKVDEVLGKSFQGLRIGTRAATSIFMYSFSGGIGKGCNLGDIKRSATTLDNPPSIVAEATEQLKSKLFFLQEMNDKYFFSNNPNLNLIHLTKMENIKEEQMVELHKELFGKLIIGDKLKIYLWPKTTKDVSDSPELKLVILKEKNDIFMKQLIEQRGEIPRVYRNTIIFLTILESELSQFTELIKRKIAYEQIETDKTLRLSDEQRNKVRNDLKKDSESLKDAIRRCYRIVYTPSKDQFNEVDLGIPTFGENKSIDQSVYDKLRSEEEILEIISPIVIKERYLTDKEYLKVYQIYDSMFKTPGQTRIISKGVIENAIKNGVKQGKFGLGEIDDGEKITCNFFKEDVNLSIEDMNIIINENLCKTLLQGQLNVTTISDPILATSLNKEGEHQILQNPDELLKDNTIRDLVLRFNIPRGKISQIMYAMNFLQQRFQSINIEIKATNGSISRDDYDNKIKEGLLQLGIKIEDTQE